MRRGEIMFDSQTFGDFSEFSDDELVRLAADSDEGAFRELALRYIYLIQSIALKYKSSSLESDDLVQEGLLGLLSAVKSFDKSKGFSFKTYAGSCIKNKIVSAVRTAVSEKNKVLNNSVLLDNESEISADRLSEPEAVILSKEAAEHLKLAISEELTELEQNVLSLYLLGYSYAEIAERLRIDGKSCDNAMQRVRRKLKSSNYMPK